MSERLIMDARPGDPTRRALGLLLARLGLVGAGTVLGWLALVAWTDVSAFPPSASFAAVALLPVNVVSLVLVRRMLHADGRRARDLIGFRRDRLVRDVGWGLAWLGVLYVPFVVTIMGVMWLLHGNAMFDAFETVFYDPATAPTLVPAVSVALGVIVLLTFAPLNAPVEELVYRGYAQQNLARRWPAGVAIVVSAIAFGFQHAFFAPTQDAVVVYVAAFFVWGVGSGVIVHRQGRLFPIIVAHFLVNLFTSAPALVLAIMQATGQL